MLRGLCPTWQQYPFYGPFRPLTEEEKVISAPAEGDDGSRLELLLADIRDVFAEKMDLEITSADLVKALVAIEATMTTSR
jgi:hypothetical protein